MRWSRFIGTSRVWRAAPYGVLNYTRPTLHEPIHMHIHDAVASRLSVRAFLPEPVDGETIRKVLTMAARAPSGGNLQPWHIDVLAGDALAALRTTMHKRLSEGG